MVYTRLRKVWIRNVRCIWKLVWKWTTLAISMQAGFLLWDSEIQSLISVLQSWDSYSAILLSIDDSYIDQLAPYMPHVLMNSCYIPKKSGTYLQSFSPEYPPHPTWKPRHCPRQDWWKQTQRHLLVNAWFIVLGCNFSKVWCSFAFSVAIFSRLCMQSMWNCWDLSDSTRFNMITTTWLLLR